MNDVTADETSFYTEIVANITKRKQKRGEMELKKINTNPTKINIQ
jgi:hypothetical protein